MPRKNGDLPHASPCSRAQQLTRLVNQINQPKRCRPVAFVMFVPRVLRLKRPHESPECGHNGTHVPMERLADGPEKDVDRAAGFDNATRIHAQDAQLSASGMSSDYLAQVAVGIELLFTDFALQDEKNAAWLASLYRVVEGEMNCKNCVFPVRTWPNANHML